MNGTMNLFRMQSRQREHDIRFHTDIYGGDLKQRVAHYAHHYAKYVGRLASLLKHNRNEEPTFSEGLERTITDAFIITLASSEALNIDFEDVKAKYAVDSQKQRKPPQKVAETLLYDLAIYQGGIAKALDSYDHMEVFAIGEELRQRIKDIMRILLTTADSIGLNLETTTFTRWKDIEAKRIL